jgi:2-polyprenyl-3-methyl-5-hydroxy-6-metoxy-1,4-benzoquinol methylase
MSKRAFALKLWDHVRFRLITTRFFFDKPKVKYQPLPFVGIQTAKRAAGSESRLSAITSFLDKQGIDGGSAVDYGCNVGYFSLSLCRQGFFVYGVEEDDRALSTAYTASRLIGVISLLPYPAACWVAKCPLYAK